MFGRTPSNLPISLLQPGQVEILAGVNLPMLVQLASLRNRPLHDAVRLTQEAGHRSIAVASRFLEEGGRG